MSLSWSDRIVMNDITFENALTNLNRWDDNALNKLVIHIDTGKFNVNYCDNVNDNCDLIQRIRAEAVLILELKGYLGYSF
jgi:hypothetical protein